MRSFPGPGGAWQVSTGGGKWPRWSRKGNEFFYVSPDNQMMAAAASAEGGTFVPGTPAALFSIHAPFGSYRPQYDVARDGRFLINTELQDASTEPIRLLLNWRPPPK